MSIELRVPEVGESISEVQIGDWAHQEGELVERDQALVSIETDKVTVDVSAPARGRLSKIILQKGANARVGDVVALFEAEPGSESTERTSTELHQAKGSKQSAEANEPQQVTQAMPDGVSARGRDLGTAPGSNVGVTERSDAPWASPAARRALAERGLRPEDVAKPKEGPILKEDVVRAAATQPKDGSHDSDADEEVISMSPLRRRVAERLVESQQSMALLTTFNEIDMTAVQQIRHEAKTAFLEKHGVKLGLMSFFVRAALEALKAYPVVNAEVRGSSIVYKNHYDIGIAIGGGRGLVVPVLRNVERLGLAAIERAIGDFSARAKNNKLELRELTGGTFTISNGGVYGSMLSTPIVNPPQSAILGLHAINDRPVAIQGQVVVRPMMYVALTYDHRIIDGREAVSFLRTVKELIENPIRILLEY